MRAISTVTHPITKYIKPFDVGETPIVREIISANDENVPVKPCPKTKDVMYWGENLLTIPAMLLVNIALAAVNVRNKRQEQNCFKEFF